MSPLGQLHLQLQLVSSSLLLATRRRPKYVHQLRVNTRRAIAILGMFEGLFDAKDVTWMTKQLHRIRRAAGNARDLDVLMGRYAQDHETHHRKLLRRIRKDRRDSQVPIECLQRQLIESGKLQQRIASLMDAAGSGSLPSKSAMEHMMRESLGTTTGDFLTAARSVDTRRDAKSLHQLRLRTKELRYAIEFCDPLLNDDLQQSIYLNVVDVQDRLGKINDHASAIRRLSRWQKSAASQHKAKLFGEQRSKEKAQLRKSIQQFKKWWTLSLVKQVEESFGKQSQRSDQNWTADDATPNVDALQIDIHPSVE